MATDQRNILAFLGNDADFRTWGLALNAQFAAVGLIQTADTGQINWTTVIRPSANTTAGYEIWRFNDALQSTHPVFIAVLYGVGALADRPALTFIVSTGTNGAGGLTGQIGATVVVRSSLSKTTGVTLPSYCSGSTSRLNLCTNLDNSTAGTFQMTALIERTVTAAGVPTADGIVTTYCGGDATNGPSGYTFQTIPFTGTVPTKYSNNSGSWPWPPYPSSFRGSASIAGTNVALLPGVSMVGGKAGFVTPLVYNHADIGELVTFTTAFMGTTRTYLPLGDGGPVSPAGTIGGNTTIVTALAVLWE